MKSLYVALFLFLISLVRPAAQTTEGLNRKIQQIISTKKAVVGVAISGNNGKDTLLIRGNGHFPLQSVFKLHIGLAVLSEVDKGRFSLNQKIKIKQKDLLPDLYSPLRDKYPKGAELPLSEILAYTVSESDNVGCEVLLRLIGGPAAVENYFVKNGFKDISIKYSEEQQQGHWNLQFQNWTTPKAANEVLMAFFANHKKRLSPKSYDFIWKVMKESKTGQDRLRAQLPKGTAIAHKTGSSGTNKEGITAAVNDIGLIFLPNGRYFFISVFVTDSKEDAKTNEKIIADIGKAAWDYFTTKTN
jgi:beta-lactamase class A